MEGSEYDTRMGVKTQDCFLVALSVLIGHSPSFSISA